MIVKDDDSDPRLSRITTEWNMLSLAHEGSREQAMAAQSALVMRYAGAVHRYLLGALRDPDAAAELDQEFAVRFLRGDFQKADPARGRFRDFLKRAVRNLMIDYQRKQRTRSRFLADDQAEPVGPVPVPDFEREFLESWRAELLNRAWEQLARYEARTRRPYHRLLRYRTEHLDVHSPEMAERLSEELGRQVTAGWVRQTLHLARDHFAEFLMDEVAASLKDPTQDQVEQELGELGLLDYCRPALDRRRPGHA